MSTDDMYIDMEQFHGVFFDESQEHLADMERQLMDLNLAQPDPEQLNSIFRAAHSIKGGSGIFGFDALTGLTHIMENLLDKARKNSIVLTTPIVDRLLETVDLLKMTLDNYRNQLPIEMDSINNGIAQLNTLLDGEEEALAPRANDENGFGFFAPLPGNEQTESTKDDGDFGFSDLGDTPEVKAGYGFFESPVAKVTTTQPESVTETEAKSAKTTAESSSIRVDTGKIDSLVNLVGELVITQSMLTLISSEMNDADTDKLHNAITELTTNTREIQESVMSMRMLPMHFTFNRFPRVVRDLSSKLGKKVDLKIEGGTTEIDKSMIEKLVDPLTHLVRNSIDHGIEKTGERLALGKTETGTVILRAEQKGGSILISIIDDGAGLNRDRILAKANENGLAVDHTMPDKDVWKLIFAAGFSTAQEVTDVSGRGVGMDVVRRNLEAIGGRIDIESTAGQGSAFYIHLPLTLAIVDGICVSVGDQIFVVPLDTIIESVQPQEKQIKLIANEKLLWIRDEYWPLVRLHQKMEIDNAITEPSKAIVMLIESSEKRFGLVVDSLLGQQQVVIKSLEQNYRRVDGVAGATIMGDGRVALILDVESLANNVITVDTAAESTQ
ncbi:MAG: two-component system chemotaxis sensor kinase CheA [Paraglaciecola sp.]|jgi:two-component system chemotaxis sensor kinase CheA